MRENNRNCSKNNVFMTNKIPQKLEKCNPRQRFFPLSWKEAYFRMNMSNQLEGYVCPSVRNFFVEIKALSNSNATIFILFLRED